MNEPASYEQVLPRFTKSGTQQEMRQVDREEAHLEYVKLDRELDRLEGSIQAVEYLAYGKMPGDGNHDGFKAHKPKPQQLNDLGSLD